MGAALTLRQGSATGSCLVGRVQSKATPRQPAGLAAGEGCKKYLTLGTLARIFHAWHGISARRADTA